MVGPPFTADQIRKGPLKTDAYHIPLFTDQKGRGWKYIRVNWLHPVKITWGTLYLRNGALDTKFRGYELFPGPGRRIWEICVGSTRGLRGSRG